MKEILKELLKELIIVILSAPLVLVFFFLGDGPLWPGLADSASHWTA